MKRMLSRLLKLTFIFVLSFVLIACGNKEPEQEAASATLPGEYKLTSVRYNDESGEEAFDETGISGKLVLKEDGTGSIDVFGTNLDITYDAEAKVISTDQADAEFTFEKGVIEFTLDENFIYVFTKTQ